MGACKGNFLLPEPIALVIRDFTIHRVDLGQSSESQVLSGQRPIGSWADSCLPELVADAQFA
jgi:hypothetical protein